MPLNAGSNFRMLRFCDEDGQFLRKRGRKDFETLLAVEDGLIMLSKLPDGSGAGTQDAVENTGT